MAKAKTAQNAQVEKAPAQAGKIERGTILAAGYMVYQPFPTYKTVIGKDGEPQPVKAYACKKVGSKAQLDDGGLHTIYLTEDGSGRFVSTDQKGIFKIESVSASGGPVKTETAFIVVVHNSQAGAFREVIEKNAKLITRAGTRGRGGSIDEYIVGEPAAE